MKPRRFNAQLSGKGGWQQVVLAKDHDAEIAKYDPGLWLLMKHALEHVNTSAQTAGFDGVAVAISFSALESVKKAIAAIGWQQHVQMERAHHAQLSKRRPQVNKRAASTKPRRTDA